LHPLTVLIVDESAMLRAMLKRVIQISGVPLERVFEATTAAGGLGVLEMHPVDVVFANIDASQQQGHLLLRGIAARPEWRTVLRVGTSTRATGPPDAGLALLGVEVQVGTPFRPEMLREAIAPLLRGDGATEPER
jgi:two-component system chemotaxis response regulator CheY